MKLMYKRCAGLDVHQRTVVACVHVSTRAAWIAPGSAENTSHLALRGSNGGGRQGLDRLVRVHVDAAGSAGDFGAVLVERLVVGRFGGVWRRRLRGRPREPNELVIFHQCRLHLTLIRGE